MWTKILKIMQLKHNRNQCILRWIRQESYCWVVCVVCDAFDTSPNDSVCDIAIDEIHAQHVCPHKRNIGKTFESQHQPSARAQSHSVRQFVPPCSELWQTFHSCFHILWFKSNETLYLKKAFACAATTTIQWYWSLIFCTICMKLVASALPLGRGKSKINIAEDTSLRANNPWDLRLSCPDNRVQHKIVLETSHHNSISTWFRLS